MKCLEFESILADYLDGTLPDRERAAVDEHATQCASCRAFLADASAGANFLRRAENVAPPHELLTRIAYHAPIGRLRHPLERQGLFARLASKWLQPLLQPRLAMGMAMTILSFAMLDRCTGVQVQHIETADLSPVRVWTGVEDKAIRVKDRAVKYYDNLRFAYQIESRLTELQEQASQPQTPEPSKSTARRAKQVPSAPAKGANKQQ
jgi:anti-sigma factor RsiW